MENSTLLVVGYCIVLLLFVITGLTKAKYHMDYLKIVSPEEYKQYSTYFSVFSYSTYSVGLQFLFFPFFIRSKDKDNDISLKIAKKVWIFLIANLLLLFLLLSPILVAVIR